MYCPSFMPTRTPPRTWGNGRSEMASAAPAPHDGQRIGILLGIGRQDHGDDLGFVEKPFGEQRADRAINQPAGENFLFGGTSLALDKAARDLAGGVSVFAVVYREREESSSRFRIVSHAGGDQDHRVTRANDNRAVRLSGHFAGFQGNCPATQIDFNGMRHILNLYLQPRPGAGPTAASPANR